MSGPRGADRPGPRRVPWSGGPPRGGPRPGGAPCILARFSYDLLPVDRDRAMGFIRREVEAARAEGLSARLLVPLTRGEGGAALQFEVELTSLGQLETLRHRGGAARTGTRASGCAPSARSC